MRPAASLIEVISEESVNRDRVGKFEEQDPTALAAIVGPEAVIQALKK